MKSRTQANPDLGHAALAMTLALFGAACVDPANDDDIQDDDDTAEDDDSGDDDDSAAPFVLPPVSTWVEPRCRADSLAATPVDWAMQTEWRWEPSAADGDLPDLIQQLLVVEDQGEARVLAARVTGELGPWPFGDHPIGGQYVAALDGTGDEVWRMDYDFEETAASPGGYAGGPAADLDGDGEVDDVLLSLATSDSTPWGWATWPDIITTGGGWLVRQSPMDDPVPLAGLPIVEGQGTSLRWTWADGADVVFLGWTEMSYAREEVTIDTELFESWWGQGESYEWLPVDVDLDGVLDVPHGATVTNGRTGADLWTALDFGEPSDEYDWNLFPLQADCDAQPEFVAVSDFPTILHLIDHDGVVLWTREHTSTSGVPVPQPRPAIGDLDGDGSVEIVMALRFAGDPTIEVVAWTLDGDELWVRPLTEPYEILGRSTPSLFDFDGDGAMEVVFQVEDALYLLDGTSGTILSSIENWDRGGFSTPLIADVDADGSAEIVVTNKGFGTNVPLLVPSQGIRVLGPATGAWAPAPPRWDQAAWQPARWTRDQVETGGSPPFWREHEGTRAQATLYPLPESSEALPNPQIATAVVDRTGCPESVDAWVAVRNTGTRRSIVTTLELETASGPMSVPVPALQPGETSWLLAPDLAPQKAPVAMALDVTEDQCQPCDDDWTLPMACW